MSSLIFQVLKFDDEWTFTFLHGGLCAVSLTRESESVLGIPKNNLKIPWYLGCIVSSTLPGLMFEGCTL